MHAGEVGTKRCAAEVVERARGRARHRVGDERLERGENALAVGLSEWDQSYPG